MQDSQPSLGLTYFPIIQYDYSISSCLKIPMQQLIPKCLWNCAPNRINQKECADDMHSHPVFIGECSFDRRTHTHQRPRNDSELLFISRIVGFATRTHTTEPHFRIKKANRKIVQRFEFSVFFMTCQTGFSITWLFLSFLFRDHVSPKAGAGTIPQFNHNYVAHHE